jgi:hypothetical protein
MAARGPGLLNADRGDHAAATHWLTQAAATCSSVSDRYQWVDAHVLDAANTGNVTHRDRLM